MIDGLAEWLAGQRAFYAELARDSSKSRIEIASTAALVAKLDAWIAALQERTPAADDLLLLELEALAAKPGLSRQERSAIEAAIGKLKRLA